MVDTPRIPWVENWWLSSTVAVASIVSIVAASDYYRHVRRTEATPVYTVANVSYEVPVMNDDAALFLYSGRQMLRGQFPYRHIWDIKPPGIHDTAGLIAVVTGGDRLLMYLVSTGITAIAVIGSAVLLAVITYRLTGSSTGGFAAGIVPFTYPPLYEIVWSGIRPKYFVCLFGLLTIYLYLDDRPSASAVSASLAAAYWQLGIVFPIAVLVGYRREGTERDLPIDVSWWVAAHMFGMAVMVVAPMAIGDALVPMIAQTVFAPIVATESEGLLSRLVRMYLMLGAAWSVPVLGALGSASVYRLQMLPNRRGSWWAVTGIGWFILGVLWFDLDGVPDLIPLVVLSGLGIGITVGVALSPRRAERSFGRALIAGLIGIALVIAFWHTLPWISGDTATIYGGYQGLNDIVVRYWSDEPANSCHVLLSGTERQWIRATPANEFETPCWGSRPSELMELLRYI